MVNCRTSCSGILSAKGSSSFWQLHRAEGSVKRTLEGKGRYENQNVRHGSDSGLSYHAHMNIDPFTFSKDCSAPLWARLLICGYTQVDRVSHGSCIFEML